MEEINPLPPSEFPEHLYSEEMPASPSEPPKLDIPLIRTFFQQTASSRSTIESEHRNTLENLKSKITHLKDEIAKIDQEIVALSQPTLAVPSSYDKLQGLQAKILSLSQDLARETSNYEELNEVIVKSNQKFESELEDIAGAITFLRNQKDSKIFSVQDRVELAKFEDEIRSFIKTYEHVAKLEGMTKFHRFLETILYELTGAKKIQTWFRKWAPFDAAKLHVEYAATHAGTAKGVPLRIGQVDRSQAETLRALIDAAWGDVAEQKQEKLQNLKTKLLNPDSEIEIEPEVLENITALKEKLKIDLKTSDESVINQHVQKQLEEEIVQFESFFDIINYIDDELLNLDENAIVTIVRDANNDLQGVCISKPNYASADTYINFLLTAPHNLSLILDMRNPKKVEGAGTALISDAVFRSYRRKRDTELLKDAEYGRTAVKLQPLASAKKIYTRLGFEETPGGYMLLRGESLRKFLRTRGGRASPSEPIILEEPPNESEIGNH